LGRLGVRELLEESIPVDLWSSSLSTTNDTAGLITVAFLVRFVETGGDKSRQLGQVARGRLRATLSEKRPINSLASLGVIGREGDEDLSEDCIRRVVSIRAEDVWAVGYARWIQRTTRAKGGWGGGREMAGEVLGSFNGATSLVRGLRGIHPRSLSQKLRNNLHLVFLLYFLMDSGGFSAKVGSEFERILNARIRWEWRRSVRSLLESCKSGEFLDGERDWPIVAHTLEKVLPNVEALGGSFGETEE
jgi:hypothetical protein